jgi:hypothetical protein
VNAAVRSGRAKSVKVADIWLLGTVRGYGGRQVKPPGLGIGSVDEVISATTASGFSDSVLTVFPRHMRHSHHMRHPLSSYPLPLLLPHVRSMINLLGVLFFSGPNL